MHEAFWGARNDKTIVRYDKHIMDLKNGVTYENIEYELINLDGVPHKRKGKLLFSVIITAI